MGCKLGSGTLICKSLPISRDGGTGRRSGLKIVMQPSSTNNKHSNNNKLLT